MERKDRNQGNVFISFDAELADLKWMLIIASSMTKIALT